MKQKQGKGRRLVLGVEAEDGVGAATFLLDVLGAWREPEAEVDDQ